MDCTDLDPWHSQCFTLGPFSTAQEWHDLMDGTTHSASEEAETERGALPRELGRDLNLSSEAESSACFSPLSLRRGRCSPRRAPGDRLQGGHSARKRGPQLLGQGCAMLDLPLSRVGGEAGGLLLSLCLRSAGQTARLPPQLPPPLPRIPLPVRPQAHQVMSVPHSSHNNTFVRRETGPPPRGRQREPRES